MAPLDIEGVTILPGEEEKVKAAMEALAKDPHAPRIISVGYSLHIHNEYPKLVYKGKDSLQVANEAEEAAAVAKGFGDFAVVADEPTEEAKPAAPQVPAAPASPALSVVPAPVVPATDQANS